MKKKAFTLIELLVVIAIIALLMAIIVPGMKKAKEKTYLVICRSNLRQIGISQFSYANDFNGRITPGDAPSENGPSHIWEEAGGIGGVCNLGHLLESGYLPMPSLRAGKDNIRSSAMWDPALLRGYGKESWDFYRLWTNEEVPGVAPSGQRNLSGWGQPNRIVVCNYEFRVRMDNPDLYHINNPDSVRADLSVQSKGMPLEKLGGSAIASDLWSWGFGKLVHNDTYNILVSDGSVLAVNGEGLFDHPTKYDPWWPMGYRSDLIFSIFDKELGLRQPAGVSLPIDFYDYYFPQD